jgi:hypothetical protein
MKLLLHLARVFCLIPTILVPFPRYNFYFKGIIPLQKSKFYFEDISFKFARK